MGRAVSFMVDEKAADVECERFLDMKYDPALLEDDASSIGTRKSSLNYLREHLPSIKDIFKLVLFCTVTVVGMNFISGAIPSRGWHNVRSFHLHPIHLIYTKYRSPRPVTPIMATWQLIRIHVNRASMAQT